MDFPTTTAVRHPGFLRRDVEGDPPELKSKRTTNDGARPEPPGEWIRMVGGQPLEAGW